MRPENVAEAASAYEESPVVAAISVLTNHIHFGMDIERLSAIRRTNSKPILGRISSSRNTRCAKPAPSERTRFCSWPTCLTRRAFPDFTTSRANWAWRRSSRSTPRKRFLPCPGRAYRRHQQPKVQGKKRICRQARRLGNGFQPGLFGIRIGGKASRRHFTVAESGLSPEHVIQVRERFDAALVGTSLLRDARGIRASLEEFEEVIRSGGLKPQLSTRNFQPSTLNDAQT